MRLRLSAALILLGVLFVVANRGAYKGWFMDDDMDNLAWTSAVGLKDFATGLISPRYYAQNFRPAGHLYFHLMERWNHLYYPSYVRVLQGVHLLNILLVFLLLLKVPLPDGRGSVQNHERQRVVACFAGAMLFAFHIGVFEAYWKPMYIFDVLCGMFLLLALLSYVSGRWIAGLVFFWLAYKSKEHALLLPAVLALYEYWFGGRRWKRLIPYFCISALFGVQALLFNPNLNNSYSLCFRPLCLARTLRFYASQVLLWPVIVTAPFLVKDRWFRFGLFVFLALLLPMLLLPGRLYGAYLYVPLIGLAIAMAAIATRPVPVAVFFLIWLPLNYMLLREKRKAVIAQGDANREYVWALAETPKLAPDARTFIYDGEPGGFKAWGVEGALKYFYRTNVTVATIDALDLKPVLKDQHLALISYDPGDKKLSTVPRATAASEPTYITMNRLTPFWQLNAGWFSRENRFRWTRPRATARLLRPARAEVFELEANIGPDYIAAVKQAEVEVILNGLPLGTAQFTSAGWQKVTWPAPPGEPGPVTVEFHTRPEFRPKNDPRVLGLPIGGFGFR